MELIDAEVYPKILGLQAHNADPKMRLPRVPRRGFNRAVCVGFERSTQKGHLSWIMKEFCRRSQKMQGFKENPGRCACILRRSSAAHGLWLGLKVKL